MGGFTGTLRSRCRLLGSFSNNDGDRNENVKKDVKMPNFLKKTQTRDDEIFFLFLNLSAVLKKSTPGKFASIRNFQRI